MDGSFWGIEVPSLSLDTSTDFTVEMEINPASIEAVDYSFSLVREYDTSYDNNGFYLDVFDGHIGYNQHDNTVWEGAISPGTELSYKYMADSYTYP